MEVVKAQLTIYIDERVSSQLAAYVTRQHPKAPSDAAQDAVIRTWTERLPTVIGDVDALTTLAVDEHDNQSYKSMRFHVREATKRQFMKVFEEHDDASHEVRHIHTALAVDTLCRARINE